MTDIKLDHEALRKHANHLLGAADKVQEIYGELPSIHFGSEEFGVMCSMLPPIINAVTPNHQSVLSSTRHLLESSSEALKQAADDHFDTDEQIASNLNRLQMRLGGM